MKQCHLQQPQTVNSPCPSVGGRSHTLCPSHRDPGARLSNAEGKVLGVHAMCVDPPGIIRVKTSPSLKVMCYMIPLDDILEITTWWMEYRPVMVQIQEARVWPSRGERGDWCGAAVVRGLDCDVATMIYTCDQTARVTDTHAQISVTGRVITRHAIVVETGWRAQGNPSYDFCNFLGFLILFKIKLKSGKRSQK